MRQILFATKQDSKRTINTDDLIKMFEKTDNLNQLKSVIEKAEDRIYLTWASVDMKDKSDEIIPIEDLAKQQDILLERNGPITDSHTNRVIGETLAYKILEHPKTKTKGILHLERIFNHNEFDDKVWGEIQDGTRTGSSVGGFNTGVSQKYDEVTESNATSLDGFQQFETASVDDPCNPLALNEAFSVVAKSKSKGDINKKDILFSKHIKSIIKGDTKMANDITKDISEIKKAIEANAKAIAKLSKEDVPPESEEEKEEEEQQPDLEVKQDEETPAEEEEKEDEEEVEKKKQEEETEEEKEDDEIVEKEDAASDIEGEEAAEAQPDTPVVEDSNDADVFKKEVKKNFAEIKKQIKSIATTPQPGTASEVKKEETLANLPMDLATGKKKMGYQEVNKSWNEHLDRISQGGMM